MAGISVDFRNIARSQKCAVSSPGLVTLGIRDESSGVASERLFQGIFHNDQVCRNEAKNSSNLTYGSDNLFYSQTSLSTSTCDSRPTDKVKNDSDIHLNLLDLLNSADLKQAVISGEGNFKSAADDKMKTISNSEASGDLSDLLSSLAQDISETDARPKFENCQRRNVENKCADSLSSLKVEGNLSDLLSSINIEDSDVTKGINVKSSFMYSSKVANKSKIENEPSAADLSDLLSSIDLEGLNDNKVKSCNRGNVSSMKISQVNNESSLADLLSCVDKSNMAASALSNDPPINLSDLLSSKDLSDNNVGNGCNMKILEVKNETCLADLLSSVDIDTPSKSASTTFNYGNSNLHSKETNVPDSFDYFTFDIASSSSSNNSCASSYSEKENNTLGKNNLTDKIFESDSGYNSFDSAQKEFSFFDYSSANQFSFNTVLNNKSDAHTDAKHLSNKDANEEMSMSDLMAIVSPEFKNPILATLNKAEKPEDSVNKDCSSMQDLMKCLNINNDVNGTNYDCVDGQTSKNFQSRIETTDRLSRKDEGSVCKSDITNDKVSNDDDQITFIDLRECIKSTKNQPIPASPVRQDKTVEKQSLECFSPHKIPFYHEENLLTDSSRNESNSFDFNMVDNKKKSRVNTKETLFSKALACKPKKDESLLQKVANIKIQLLKNIIHRPVFIDCNVPQPKAESVLQSDKCILSNKGLVSFGLPATC